MERTRHGGASIIWYLHRNFDVKQSMEKLRADIGKILRKLCEEKKVEIIEAEACIDHVHMLVSMPPYI